MGQGKEGISFWEILAVGIGFLLVFGVFSFVSLRVAESAEGATRDVSGRVFYTANDGTLVGFSDVQISLRRLKDGEIVDPVVALVVTDNLGNYTLVTGHLSEGPYRVVLNPEDLPPEYVVKGLLTRDVVVLVGGTVSSVDFEVVRFQDRLWLPTILGS